MSDAESPQAEEPTESWVVEVCVLGREKAGSWRVQFLNTRERAEEQTAKWNAERPAGYSHRVRRYVPEERLEAAERRVKTLEADNRKWRELVNWHRLSILAPVLREETPRE